MFEFRATRESKVTELCSSLLPTFVAGIIGYLLFLRKEEQSADNSSNSQETEKELPKKSRDECAALKASFLQELLRLAEVRMGAQEEVARTHERKAVLLATLCIVMIGYYLTQWGSMNPMPLQILRLSTLLFLIFAALFCVRAINFASYGQLGLPPQVVMPRLESPQDNDFEYTMYRALSLYHKRIYTNSRANNRKHKNLVTARWLWVAGTSTFIGLLVLQDKPTRTVVECLCVWLVGQ